MQKHLLWVARRMSADTIWPESLVNVHVDLRIVERLEVLPSSASRQSLQWRLFCFVSCIVHLLCTMVRATWKVMNPWNLFQSAWRCGCYQPDNLARWRQVEQVFVLFFLQQKSGSVLMQGKTVGDENVQLRFLHRQDIAPKRRLKLLTSKQISP